MKTLFQVVGGLIGILAVIWPISHGGHNCPPIEQWRDSICPKAQIMEAFMFLQIAVGFILMTLIP